MSSTIERKELQSNIYDSNTGYTNLMNAINKCDLDLVKKYLLTPETSVNLNVDMVARYGYYSSKHMKEISTIDISNYTLNIYKRYYLLLNIAKCKNLNTVNENLVNGLKNNNYEYFSRVMRDLFDIYPYNVRFTDDDYEVVNRIIDEPLLDRIVNTNDAFEIALDMMKRAKKINDLLVSNR